MNLFAYIIRVLNFIKSVFFVNNGIKEYKQRSLRRFNNNNNLIEKSLFIIHRN